jgi:hypothetical protein
MILLEMTLDILTALVRQTWHDPLVGLLLMVAVSAVVAWRASRRHRSHRWVVRKGVCPCCGRALFGTTLAYQRLPGLALVYPESPYLCPSCDCAKVTALQRHSHLERADE